MNFSGLAKSRFSKLTDICSCLDVEYSPGASDYLNGCYLLLLPDIIPKCPVCCMNPGCLRLFEGGITVAL